MGANDVGQPFKVCTACHQKKPESDYYSKGQRLESICKACKRAYRKARYEPKRPLKSPVEPDSQTASEPRRSIEPALPATETRPSQLIEPIFARPQEPIEQKNLHESVALYDWSMWEEMYGRKLTTAEKLAIKTNLFGYYEIMLDGYLELKKNGIIQ